MANLFKDHKLFRNDPENATSEEVNVAESLEGKVVALYFSAHWSPPCRSFTPLLKTFYEQLADQPFEIVFVTFDRTDDNLKEYLKESHGKWLYVQLNDPCIQELSQKYEVTEIPTLVIVKSDGEIIDKNAKNKVQDNQDTPAVQVFDQWKTCDTSDVPPSVTATEEEEIIQ